MEKLPPNVCYLLRTVDGFGKLTADEVRYMPYEYYKKIWEGRDLMEFRTVRRYARKKAKRFLEGCETWNVSDLLANRDIRCNMN